MNPLIAFAISVYSAVVCNSLAKKKGKKPGLWTSMGFILGPIPIVILLFSQPVEAQPKESFIDRVRYYFELGLLGDNTKTSFEAVASSIRQQYIEDWGEDFETDAPVDEMYIVNYGSNQTWWKDTEADVLKGNNSYVNSIKEWGVISDGVFLPKNIKEHWKTDHGPIEIAFEFNNTTHTFSPRYLDDYIDMEILKTINQLLPDSDNTFEMVAPFDQTAFVLWLSRQQKQALLKRGWKFSW